jgi:hypothetical protein
MVTTPVDYCLAEQPNQAWFNQAAQIPFGVTVEHVRKAMTEFTDFLGFVDSQLATKEIERFEDMLMPANFSSIVGEFVTASLPKHCPTIVKNAYHNGHPDMLPAGKYPRNAAQHAGADGIEVKASRYLKAWQGHNAEDVWLMVFVYSAGRPTDKVKGIHKAPFRFLMVCGALLEKSDWQFAGRSATSRRTITASVTGTGYAKMAANWIYRVPELDKGKLDLLPADAEF